MTQLRNKMLEELQRRNYSHRTAKTYVRIVREFAEYFHQSPDKLGPEQIRQYQAYQVCQFFCVNGPVLFLGMGARGKGQRPFPRPAM